MAEPTSLAAAFLAALPETSRIKLLAPSALEPHLTEGLRVAIAAWPGLILEPTRFATYLAASLAEDLDPRHPLASVRVTDLYLACACACGVPGAVEALEASCIAAVEPAIARLGLGTTQIEEIKQALRHQLLVADPGKPPLITRYSGRGPLPAWVRVVALRLALKHQQRVRREVPIEKQMLEALPLADEDAELHYIKDVYRGEFQEAFAEALRSLSPRDTRLLLHHYVDGLSTHEIGDLFRVNQSTAARWLERARQTIFTATLRGLEKRLDADPAAAASILRLVHSHLDLSLRGLLGK
jgi:RNA polymerase sigma-70 factor, ECF subfamily